MTGPSLYERIGKKDAARAAVMKMHGKVLGDDRISTFFADADMERLRRMNTVFVNMALGGEEPQRRAAHAHLLPRGMNGEHFDIMVAHLEDAMRELGMEEQLIRAGIAAVESFRNDVLNR